MALRDDVLILGAAALGGYFLWKKLNVDNIINAIAPNISPSSWTAAVQESTRNNIQPVASMGGYANQFKSSLADWVTGAPLRSVYAVFPDDPYLYLVDDAGTHQLAFTKQDLIDKTNAFVAAGSPSSIDVYSVPFIQ